MRHPGRGMNSLLAAVEVAATHEPSEDRGTPLPLPPPPSSQPVAPVPIASAHPSGAPRSEEPRKGARVFTSDQRKMLESQYKLDKFPTRQMMESFAVRLGKPIEKVRTWFNNRRALDRKLGHEVVRGTSSKQVPSAPSTASTTVIPSLQSTVQHRGLDHVLAVRREPHPGSSAFQESSTSNDPTLRPVATDPLVPPSTPHTGSTHLFPQFSKLKQHTPHSEQHSAPSSRTGVPIPQTMEIPRWGKSAPVVPKRLSNVTPRTPQSGASTESDIRTPLRGSSGSRRLSPLRLRGVRLRLGEKTLAGEGHPDNLGLEVKFLFGKRRLVYEWYIGQNFAEAGTTGGPYAKIEINFDSVYNINFMRTPNGSRIDLALSDTPALYRQVELNMLKFRSRSQQRQYLRARQDRFSENDSNQVNVGEKNHTIFLRSDDAAKVRKTLLEFVPELGSLIDGITPGNYYPPSTATAADSNSGNAPPPQMTTQTRDLQTPADATPSTPWHLPSCNTPQRLDSRTVRRASPYFETGVITPMSEQHPRMSTVTPRSGPLVRRALDFTPGRPNLGVGLCSLKRQIDVGDENDAASANKPKKLRPCSLPNSKPTVINVCPAPPLPPPLPPQLPENESKEVQVNAEAQ